MIVDLCDAMAFIDMHGDCVVTIPGFGSPQRPPSNARITILA
jgi:hypothetical protein